MQNIYQYFDEHRQAFRAHLQSLIQYHQATGSLPPIPQPTIQPPPPIQVPTHIVYNGVGMTLQADNTVTLDAFAHEYATNPVWHQYGAGAVHVYFEPALHAFRLSDAVRAEYNEANNTAFRDSLTADDPYSAEAFGYYNNALVLRFADANFPGIETADDIQRVIDTCNRRYAAMAANGDARAPTELPIINHDITHGVVA